MSEALADAGIVERDYAERCIARERTNPTGLVTAAGSIAPPHADPQAGEKMGIAVARPSSPVESGAIADEGTADAKVAFVLAVAGGDAELDGLPAHCPRARRCQATPEEESPMKRVLIACGTGIATSTVVADKVRKHLAANGIEAKIDQTKVAELHRGAKGYDLIVATTNVPN